MRQIELFFLVFVLIFTAASCKKKEPSQDWWCLEQENDRIKAFLDSRERVLQESFPSMEYGAVDANLRAFLDLRKSQYAEDLKNCKSQREKEVVSSFWENYFMSLSGQDKKD